MHSQPIRLEIICNSSQSSHGQQTVLRELITVFSENKLEFDNIELINSGASSKTASKTLPKMSASRTTSRAIPRVIANAGAKTATKSAIYINCLNASLDTFRLLMVKIRHISGVIDVRKVPLLPNESKRSELISIVTRLPDPVIHVDLQGQIQLANQSALALFKTNLAEITTKLITEFLPHLNIEQWTQSANSKVSGNKASGSKATGIKSASSRLTKDGKSADSIRYRDNIIFDGLNYIMDIIPIILQDDPTQTTVVSAIVTLKPIVKSEVKLSAVPDYSMLGFEHFVGTSNKYQRLINQAKKLAMLDQPLLIEGDTGTGKEMLARACHNRSLRSNQPFLVLSCASMPDDVAETELFGHAPGTFNNESGHKGIFEQADQGTVFLDEIGEMSPHLQIKLLRFLQDGSFRRVGEEAEMHVDVRIIASTKQTLTELTQEGSFREDLYYRLNVLNLSIPPLRERSGDILPLLDMFVAKYAQQLGLIQPSYDDRLVEQLTLYTWPGNIRQLENSVLRAMTQLEDDMLTFEHFQLPQLHPTSSAFSQQPYEMLNNKLDGSLDEMMRTHEAQILERLYQSFPSSRKLAKRLEVSHTSIANKLRDYGIRKS